MKILLFCAPSGEIMFVSQCFMGGTSDVTTVLKGDVVKLIEFGDEFLTDKGKRSLYLLSFVYQDMNIALSLSIQATQ